MRRMICKLNETAPALSRDDFLDSESYARYLCEQGDLGIPPNVTRSSYPRVSGDGYWATLWRAAAGATFDDHMAGNGHLTKRFKAKRRAERRNASLILQRVSDHYLTGKQAERLFNAASFCMAGHGKTFDLHGTVSWQYAGINDPHVAAEIFSDWNNQLTKHLRKFGLERLSIYVHENGRTHGFHTHFLLHAGAAWTDLQKWLPHTLECLCKHPLATNALHLEHRHARHLRSATHLHWLWLRYLLKGIQPDLKVRDLADRRRLKLVRDVFRLRPRSAGIVPCRRRAGVSEALGKTAQEEAGFVSSFSQGHDEWLYSGDELALYWDGLARKAAEQSKEISSILDLS